MSAIVEDLPEQLDIRVPREHRSHYYTGYGTGAHIGLGSIESVPTKYESPDHTALIHDLFGVGNTGYSVPSSANTAISSLGTFVVTPAAATGISAATTATNDAAIQGQLKTALHSLFHVSRDEVFESGIDNNLSVGIQVMFARYPHVLLNAIAEALGTVSRNEDTIVGETLKTLGTLDHPASVTQRVSLIASYLAFPSAHVRDSAALALSFLDSPEAVPYLRSAIEREPLIGLKEDMNSVLNQIGQ